MMTKKISGMLLIVSIVLVGGCGISMKPATWSKAGVSLAQGEKDLAQCSEKANLLNVYGEKYDDGVFYVWGSVFTNDPDKPGIIFQKCMMGKNYKKTG